MQTCNKCTVYCRDGTLAMIDKVGLCAERSWQRLRGFEWLARIVGGVNSMTEPKSMT